MALKSLSTFVKKPIQPKYSYFFYQDIFSLSISLLISDFQKLWVSVTMFVAYAAFLASPLKANWFSGLPSGIL